jgi:hypothetical protein
MVRAMGGMEARNKRCFSGLWNSPIRLTFEISSFRVATAKRLRDEECHGFTTKQPYHVGVGL